MFVIAKAFALRSFRFWIVIRAIALLVSLLLRGSARPTIPGSLAIIAATTMVTLFDISWRNEVTMIRDLAITQTSLGMMLSLPAVLMRRASMASEDWAGAHRRRTDTSGNGDGEPFNNGLSRPLKYLSKNATV